MYPQHIELGQVYLWVDICARKFYKPEMSKMGIAIRIGSSQPMSYWFKKGKTWILYLIYSRRSAAELLKCLFFHTVYSNGIGTMNLIIHNIYGGL